MVVSAKMWPQSVTPDLLSKMMEPLEVALGDDLEEGVGVFGWHGEVAEFVNDEDGGSFEEAHGVGPASFDGCFAAAGGEVGGCGVVGAVAGFGGFVTEADGEWVFPTPGGPMSMMLVASLV
nr:hypothetical protein [Candidatus Microthrix sp.]